jgi:hypothetical protein
VLPLCAAFVFGCHGEVGSTGPTTGTDSTPLCAASDPTQVVAPTRVALLTSTQLMNMVRLVSNDPAVGNAAAQMIIDGGLFPMITDLTVRFPPPKAEQIHSIDDPEKLSPFDNTAQTVGNYVTANFAAVTGCQTPGTDACASTYLNSLATKAYRRPLTTDEQGRFTSLYSNLRSQIVNNYQVTLPVETATGDAVYGLLMSPQLLWRWELGSQASSFPSSVYLTDSELASNLSFFLTDQPPDAMLLADVQAGKVRANVSAHIDRILGAQPATAKTWMTHVMEMYFFLNQLPTANIDPSLPNYAIVGGGAVYSDLQMASRLFLSDAMWNGKVMDLITSQKAFVNTNLASMIYMVPIPPLATSTNFVETTLPADQRVGMLTDAGFITSRFRTTGVGIVPRGLGVKALFTCLVTQGPPAVLTQPGGAIDMAKALIATQTAQEQVAYRQQTAPCSSCHPSFDPYGLVLDWYDAVGRYRMVDDLGKPVDGTTTLPDVLGGATVHSAVELAGVLSNSDVFSNCMAASVLQYALLDAPVELPLPLAQQRGCAAAGIAHDLRQSSGQSFTDLTKAIATSPAFQVRNSLP